MPNDKLSKTNVQSETSFTLYHVRELWKEMDALCALYKFKEAAELAEELALELRKRVRIEDEFQKRRKKELPNCYQNEEL